MTRATRFYEIWGIQDNLVRQASPFSVQRVPRHRLTRRRLASDCHVEEPMWVDTSFGPVVPAILHGAQKNTMNIYEEVQIYVYNECMNSIRKEII